MLRNRRVGAADGHVLAVGGHVLVIGAYATLAAGCAGLRAVDENAPIAISVVAREGRVLIIREPSYEAARAGSPVQVGDRIATLAKASATLRYAALDADGNETGSSCEIELPPNSELTVVGAGDCSRPAISSLSSDDGDGDGDGDAADSG